MSQNIIYSYTDADAIRDGVLIDISHLGFVYNGMVVNRITQALHADLKPTLDDSMNGALSRFGFKGSLSENDRFYEVMLCRGNLAPRDEHEKQMVVWAELPRRNKSEKAADVYYKEWWLVANEVGGWTLMYPSDY